jgi:pyruvate dehydrogenase E2 component (dihydrolipoamide acetyltransferase)
MPQITMPRLSDSMEEGTIIRWLKTDGDTVERDEELVEIETDKATVTYEADASGVLSIAVREGETVPVGAVIGDLADGASAATGSAASIAASTGGAAVAGQASTATAPAPGASAAPAQTASAATARPASPAGAQPADPGSPTGNGHLPERNVKASPLARRIAGRLGIDIAAIGGSGPHGRILKRDVIAHSGGQEGTAAAAAPALEASAPAAGGLAQAGETARGATSVEQLTRTQAVIVRRMSESRATVPAFSLEVDVDMTAMLTARARMRKLADPAPSLNDVIVKACAIALRRHPRANGSYRDGEFLLHGRVNVGIAVAAEDALIVPTITDADSRSLRQIAAESRRLIAAARDRTLTPAELAGATFTVSNLGMYGIDRFEGIINPPQAAILCIGAIVERPVVRDGAIVVRSLMSATLACDHRILYGADAAELLADIRQTLEEPLALAL